MSDIFNEENMRHILQKYVFSGETLVAGIHAVSHETEISGVFGKCTCTENSLIPDEDGSVIVLNKKKYSAYDIYIGITEQSLVIADCEQCSYLYEFEDGSDADAVDVQNVSSEIFLTDIGTCYALADIRSCEIKKGWMGSVKCSLTMRNGSHFKLMFPKLGGLGGGMQHHAEYRDRIIERLSGSAQI